MHPINKLPDLFRYGSRPAITINLITLYRVVTVPLLLALIFTNHQELFKWLLLISLLTDLVDGVLARKYKVTSLLGARLDSIGDDLTILVGVTGVFYFRYAFMTDHLYYILGLLLLHLIELFSAWIKWGKITTFHTISAKVSMFFQSMFICSALFFSEISYFLIFSAVIITAIDLIEEIILIAILKNWEANVKGIYWVMKRRKNKSAG